MTKQFSITASEAGQRLDLWLAAALQLSRSQLQKVVKAGGVTVNDKVSSAHYTLKEGDKIAYTPPLQAKTPAARVTELPEVPIIAETEEYLVIDKPAGLLMHGSDSDRRTSLVDWLLNRYPELRQIGEDPARPGIIHRLDKDVSGLVVIAKTQAAFDDLKKQFQERSVTKRYQALVYGGEIPEEGEIRFRLERSSKGYRMAARPLNQPGKLSITEFQRQQAYINYALLNVTIKTGRTHQIRAHLAAYNHPVVGDDLYGGMRFKLLNKKLGMKRVWLFAYELAFDDLEGRRQSFTLPLPEELAKVLIKIK